MRKKTMNLITTEWAIFICNWISLKVKTSKYDKYFVQDALTAGLKELRNNVVFSFGMMNAVFVLIVFLLTLNKDKIYLDWPFGIKENITINEDTQEVNLIITHA